MKANKYILTAFLILSSAFLFADGHDRITMKSNENTVTVVIDMVSLMPSVPKEATFSELEMLFPESTVNLAPVTPDEATFEDSYEPFDLSRLAPETPAEADFE